MNAAVLLCVFLLLWLPHGSHRHAVAWQNPADSRVVGYPHYNYHLRNVSLPTFPVHPEDIVIVTSTDQERLPLALASRSLRCVCWHWRGRGGARSWFWSCVPIPDRLCPLCSIAACGMRALTALSYIMVVLTGSVQTEQPVFSHHAQRVTCIIMMKWALSIVQQLMQAMTDWRGREARTKRAPLHARMHVCRPGIRTFIAINNETLAHELNQQGGNHNETWGYFPDRCGAAATAGGGAVPHDCAYLACTCT